MKNEKKVEFIFYCYDLGDPGEKYLLFFNHQS